MDLETGNSGNPSNTLKTDAVAIAAVNKLVQKSLDEGHGT